MKLLIQIFVLCTLIASPALFAATEVTFLPQVHRGSTKEMTARHLDVISMSQFEIAKYLLAHPDAIVFDEYIMAQDLTRYEPVENLVNLSNDKLKGKFEGLYNKFDDHSGEAKADCDDPEGPRASVSSLTSLALSVK